MSIQGPHVKRAHKDIGMNSRGCREGSLENAYEQGPEFWQTPLYVSMYVNHHSVYMYVHACVDSVPTCSLLSTLQLFISQS